MLMPDSYFDLDNVAAYLKAHPEVSVELYGHTDDVGEADYNETLSANRAKSAAAYLITKGIRKSRISTIGYGESRPLIDDVTEEAREVNRRVEIKFH
jgi:outer membrane protein OmpA-like peptidoglycan-associated protein